MEFGQTAIFSIFFLIFFFFNTPTDELVRLQIMNCIQIGLISIVLDPLLQTDPSQLSEDETIRARQVFPGAWDAILHTSYTWRLANTWFCPANYGLIVEGVPYKNHNATHLRHNFRCTPPPAVSLIDAHVHMPCSTA